MKGQTMTKIEYLLRTVKESEGMSGWQDSFSNMLNKISKEFPSENFSSEKDMKEWDDSFEK